MTPDTVWVLFVSVFIGILVSKTTFLERVKVELTKRKCTFLVQGLDCPFCSAFWPSLILTLAVCPEMLPYYPTSAAVISYYVGKE